MSIDPYKFLEIDPQYIANDEINFDDIIHETNSSNINNSQLELNNITIELNCDDILQDYKDNDNKNTNEPTISNENSYFNIVKSLLQSSITPTIAPSPEIIKLIPLSPYFNRYYYKGIKFDNPNIKYYDKDTNSDDIKDQGLFIDINSKYTTLEPQLFVTNTDNNSANLEEKINKYNGYVNSETFYIGISNVNLNHDDEKTNIINKLNKLKNKYPNIKVDNYSEMDSNMYLQGIYNKLRLDIIEKLNPLTNYTFSTLQDYTGNFYPSSTLNYTGNFYPSSTVNYSTPLNYTFSTLQDYAGNFYQPVTVNSYTDLNSSDDNSDTDTINSNDENNNLLYNHYNSDDTDEECGNPDLFSGDDGW
jgi:hypothetical protein